MNKQQFITTLKQQLSGLPEENQKDILADYEEHFAAGIEKGKSEEEIAKKLGDPVSIAKEVKTYSLIQKAEEQKSAKNLTRAVLATLGVSFFNLVFIVGPYMGIAATLLGFIAASVAMIFGGLFGAILVAFSPFIDSVELGTHPAAALSISFSITFLGIFFSIINYYLAKVFYKLTIAYLKLNISIIKKGV